MTFVALCNFYEKKKLVDLLFVFYYITESTFLRGKRRLSWLLQEKKPLHLRHKL